MSKRLFDKKTRTEIYKQMEQFGGEIKQDDVLFIIRPFLEAEIDIEKLKEQYRKRVANSIMARFKDDKGIRTCFSIHKENVSRYVNIDLSKNADDLAIIDGMLQGKIDGLLSSQLKVNKNFKVLKGQVSIEDITSDK